jgi:hypothetical protein
MQTGGQQGVEDGSKGNNGNDQHCAVPALVGVSFHIKDEEALDFGSGLESNRRDKGLPAQDAQPADDVTEKGLVFGGRKFGYPVILA